MRQWTHEKLEENDALPGIGLSVLLAVVITFVTIFCLYESGAKSGHLDLASAAIVARE